MLVVWGDVLVVAVVLRLYLVCQLFRDGILVVACGLRCYVSCCCWG